MHYSREVKPPKCGRPPGRPRFLRRRDRNEGGNSIKYMCRRCYVYGHNRSTCKGASAEDQHQAPETYTGPHVRPDPGTRPPPPSASADQTTIAPAPRNKPRTTSGGRKRRGGATQPHASTSNAAPSSTDVAPSSNVAPSVHLHLNQGGATVLVPLTLVQVAASTTTSFGRGVGNSSTNSRGGALRGRGAKGRERGNTMHIRNGRIVGMRILQDEGPTLTREPTPVQVSALTFCLGGGAFSSTSGRGKRPRMMDWFGTPEQWANEETLP
ncbi:hypothetical protein MKW98_012938 [Papaver atlanticum]|uniref:Uncharacterized protein n=1 Tax=Papaver atlanticum TaxID=357466 RepID=A0AAD4SK55_9MAGN|nr:hypothetical protein MKW98_012938 [Papaver atlanticum]